MKNISHFLEDKKVHQEMTARIRHLAEAIGGRVALIGNDRKIILESSSLLGLSSLMGADKRIEEKINGEWQEFVASATDRKQPFFMEDRHGLIVFSVPILNGRRNWGVFVGQGGFFDKGQGEDEQREKREELYHLLELGRLGLTWEDYLEASQKINFVRVNDLKEMAYYPAALISVLADHNGQNV